MEKTIVATKTRGPVTVAELTDRRRAARAEAAEEWRRLAALASEGTELDAIQVERLGDVADTLGLADDLEIAFNGDVDALRRAGSIWSEINRLRSLDLPSKMQVAADQIRQLEEQTRRLKMQRQTWSAEYQAIPAMTRELNEHKRNHPRVFPEV
jgi:hypothetical protein